MFDQHQTNLICEALLMFEAHKLEQYRRAENDDNTLKEDVAVINKIILMLRNPTSK